MRKNANMQKSRSPEEFIASHPQWRDLLVELRGLLRSTGLEETIKWGVPMYTLAGKNVVGLTAFKNHAALWFVSGALLKDPQGKLVNAQEGKTRGQRQWRFAPGDTVDRAGVLAYVEEAIENQRQGKTVERSPPAPISIPPELGEALERDSGAKASFSGLAPYKQREYADYIASAKRAATRASRLDRIMPMIRQGRGLNDKFRR
jgi:uncharacterized protein YdeI (YjbR/CyaY-like superfamily)